MTNHIFKLRKDLGLSKRLGCSPQDYRLNAALPQDNSSVIRLVTHGKCRHNNSAILRE